MNRHDIIRAQRNMLNATAHRTANPNAPTNWIVRGRDSVLHSGLTYREAKAVAANIRAHAGYANAERA